MEQLELSVESRTVRGGTQVKRLRSSGTVPGVVYSGGEESLPLEVNEHEFVQTVKGRPRAQLYSFKSSDETLNGLTALIKEVQIEPLKERVLHVDFLKIEEGQSFTVLVPIKVTGVPAAVKEGRGILNQVAYEVELECLPSAVPAQIDVDASALDEGEHIQIGAIELPEGAQLRSGKEMVVVNVLGSRRGAKEAQEAAAETATESTSEPAAASGDAGGSEGN